STQSKLIKLHSTVVLHCIRRLPIMSRPQAAPDPDPEATTKVCVVFSLCEAHCTTYTLALHTQTHTHSHTLAHMHTSQQEMSYPEVLRTYGPMMSAGRNFIFHQVQKSHLKPTHNIRARAQSKPTHTQNTTQATAPPAERSLFFRKSRRHAGT